jgi:hypothetical protein
VKLILYHDITASVSSEKGEKQFAERFAGGGGRE